MNIDDISRKIAHLARSLRDLRNIGNVTWEQYEADRRTQLAVERIIELIVECGTDINTALLVESGRPTPDTYYDAFRHLSDIGLVKESLAKQMASVAGMRNRIVHEYEEIDDWIVYNNIAHILKVFPVYLDALIRHLGLPAEEQPETPEPRTPEHPNT
jgi:uncharacterized protein YutE (UPF0331/DUF86 family)